MGRKSKSTGLVLREGIWHICKRIKGYGRLRESTGSSDYAEAEKYLHFRVEQIRQQLVYGVRQEFIWREAATRFLAEFKDQPSIKQSACYLSQLDPFIGDLPLHYIDDEALEPFVDYLQDSHVLTVRTRSGKLVEREYPPCTNRTVNIALEKVIRILNLCQRKWRDENKKPWLDVVPMIGKLDESDGRTAYPMTWEEQDVFFAELPEHLRLMALYKANTGTREQEVCKLRWDYEQHLPELGRSVFVIPKRFGGRHDKSGVKNRIVRVVILNDVAQRVIDAQRGKDKEWVFPYDGRALHRMNDTAWRSARERAAQKWEEKFGKPAHPDFAQIRVHDMKHTFGRRLKAAGVSLEDRKCLLGHKLQDVTELYSPAEIEHLMKEANKVSVIDSRTPTLTILREKAA